MCLSYLGPIKSMCSSHKSDGVFVFSEISEFRLSSLSHSLGMCSCEPFLATKYLELVHYISFATVLPKDILFQVYVSWHLPLTVTGWTQVEALCHFFKLRPNNDIITCCTCDSSVLYTVTSLNLHFNMPNPQLVSLNMLRNSGYETCTFSASP